jgi:two-component system CheB/CheR fusion protein
MEKLPSTAPQPASTAPEREHGASASGLLFPVVGIGASAGGLPALLDFLAHMPPDSGMAFVVVLHLSPEHASNAAVVLQSATAMPVRQVSGQAPIENNHVYVIPPNHTLVMNDGQLNLAPPARASAKHVEVDQFFRTLADAHKEKAFGIVLSGSGADGAVGLARIKEMGGVTLAQAPDDAEHDGMPRSAIETGVVDFVLPAHEMPAKLVQLANNIKALPLPLHNADELTLSEAVVPEASPRAIMEEALQEILLILHRHTGHDFRHYKRGTVLRRLERRMQVRAVPDLVTYRALLKDQPEECTALLQDLLIGVTNFFRDHEAFEALEKEVIPRLFENKQSGERVRAWVAACSTGEEAYSIAMLLADHALTRPVPPGFQVFATDIDEHAVATARAGLYPAAIEADVSAPRLRQYFTREDRHYCVKKSLRDRLLFAPHDLLRDSPFSKLDLISCRNLMIYLNRDVQARLLELFHFALNPGGYLFLGSSETPDAADQLFTPVDKKNRIYRARVLAHGARPVPSLPMNPSVRAVVQPPGQPATKPPFSYAQLHQRMLAQFGPPSMVVDPGSNILHMSDTAGRFLRFVGGEPSLNLTSIVLPELRLELRTALFQATQSGKSLSTRPIRIERNGHGSHVCMTVHPFHNGDAEADFVLVVFNEIEDFMPQEPPSGASQGRDAVLTQLEDELNRTREQLRETIERSEASTEELKASNEELQAINEELRSATEELETSKEELQSVNEELITVNYELKTKVEEAIKVNDDLNNLIASTDIATIFVDSGLHINRYTPAAASIFNIIASDAGRSLLDITHRLDYPHLAEDAADTFEKLVPIEREVRGANDKYYIVRILPYRTTDNRIGGAVLTFIDITSRHRAEERVRAGERRIQLFAESTKDYAIMTSDAEGVITSWNKGAERIFGYAEAQALGKNLDMICVPEDRAAGVPQHDRTRAREEGRVEDERWYVRNDGTRLFCSGMLTRLEGNEFAGYAKILRDITASKQAEQMREAQFASERSQREDAQAESQLKDQFLAVMSHELKQPLNLMHLNAQVLLQLPEVRNSPAGTKAATLIQRTIRSQAQIIDDLLDLSRLSTGKLTLSPADVDVCGVVNSICDVARAEAEARGVELAVQGTEQPVPLHADPVRVEQIVWNLVNNAIKFTPAEGRVTVSVVKRKDWVRIEVADSGQGITPEFLPHVFDIYRQASPPTTRTTGGLGIGLSLVKQLTELHGGRVEARSDGAGKGACFTVWLPLPKTRANNGIQDEQSVRACLAGLRILLVDDMEEAVQALKSLLEFEHAIVFTATDAMATLRLLADHDVDLVVSDIAMPGIDGYELVRRMREQEGTRDLPVIAVTGLGRTADVNRALQAGFSAHISKPVSIEALVEKIRDLGVRAE